MHGRPRPRHLCDLVVLLPRHHALQDVTDDERRFLTERYEYELPAQTIAQRPAARRDESRLLVLHGDTIEHASFSDLPSYIRPGDLLVANDARVLRARFLPKRRGGGKAQVLLLHPVADPECSPAISIAGDVVPERSSDSPAWEALVRPGARV